MLTLSIDIAIKLLKIIIDFTYHYYFTVLILISTLFNWQQTRENSTKRIHKIFRQASIRRAQHVWTENAPNTSSIRFHFTFKSNTINKPIVIFFSHLKIRAKRSLFGLKSAFTTYPFQYPTNRKFPSLIVILLPWIDESLNCTGSLSTSINLFNARSTNHFHLWPIAIYSRLSTWITKPCSGSNCWI